jgi:hypothetical protein
VCVCVCVCMRRVYLQTSYRSCTHAIGRNPATNDIEYLALPLTGPSVSALHQLSRVGAERHGLCCCRYTGGTYCEVPDDVFDGYR